MPELMRPETFAVGAKVFATRYTWRFRHPGGTHPLKNIHRLLTTYWSLSRGMMSSRHEILLQIQNAANQYVASKGVAKYNSDKVMTVRALATQAKARREGETNKANTLFQKITTPSQNASVHGGLRMERVASPKGPAVVGGELENLLKSDLARDRVQVKWDQGIVVEDPNNLYAIRKFLKSLTTDELTNAGFRVLEYNDEIGRREYAVRVEPTRLVWAAMDTPIDTTQCKLGDPPGTGLFALDTDGDFFCRVYDQNPENRGWFAHSSFLAGNDAICAGTLKIFNGRMLEICNNSGHYRPTLEHLQRACQVLLDAPYDPRNDAYALLQDFKFELPASQRKGSTQHYRIPLEKFADRGKDLLNAEDFEVSPLQPNSTTAYVYTNTGKALGRGAIASRY